MDEVDSTYSLGFHGDPSHLFKQLHSRKTWQRFECKTRKLGQLGPLTFNEVSDAGKRSPLVEIMLEWKRNALLERGCRNPFEDPKSVTVTDGYSGYLLGCQALSSTAVAEAKPVFTRLFREFGLPERIRTDNGVPFATTTLARLSSLSAFWVRLGILPELIEPGKPQQNGRYERMHRTLKAETTRPPVSFSHPGQRAPFRCPSTGTCR